MLATVALPGCPDLPEVGRHLKVEILGAGAQFRPVEHRLPVAQFGEHSQEFRIAARHQFRDRNKERLRPSLGLAAPDQLARSSTSQLSGGGKLGGLGAWLERRHLIVT